MPSGFHGDGLQVAVIAVVSALLPLKRDRSPVALAAWVPVRTRCRSAVLVIVVTAMVFFSGYHGARAESAAGPVPTGLYVSTIDVPVTFSVRLSTNGTYEVRTAQGAQREAGRWRWDQMRKEFLLTPTNSVAFQYEFRRLRVDPQEPETLQWIPQQSTGGAGGATDYVRFKRKNDESNETPNPRVRRF